MRLGVDYYPEHWHEDRWKIDAKLMRDAGFSVVRLAEFAWSRLEPSEEVYDFSWLDRAIDTLDDAGIKTVLGTPTAAPPAWMIERYPDILPVDVQGVQQGFGARLHRCFSNPHYREYARAVTVAMVDHYKGWPQVIGWQTDNELGEGPARCVCDTCAERFRQWLKRKYGTLDTLNAQWGAYFWSQEYRAWHQIPAPRQTPYGQVYHNPSLLLDYWRFVSDLIVEFHREQARIVKAIAPHQFVTHNMMGLHCHSYDHFAFGAEVDFVSWDNYPPPTGSVAMAHDLMRGIKGANFWVMEEKSGPTGALKMSPTPRPGQIRMWTWQAVARGADAVVYFRWRSCRGGAEQFWHGILNHDAVPRRRYREIKEVGAEFEQLSPAVAGTTVENDVAIVYSYDQVWAHNIQPQTDGLTYWLHGEKFHSAFSRAGVGVDIIGLSADFSKYKLVIFPSLFLLDEKIANRIVGYIKNGGWALLTARTGVKNWNNLAWDKPLPGLLAECAGIEIDEYDAISNRGQNGVRTADGKEYSVTIWCDIIDLKGAEPLARYTGDFYKDRPAITVNQCGSGRAYYLGTVPEDAWYRDMVQIYVKELSLADYPGLPEGVEASWRVAPDKKLLFLVNITGEERCAPLHGKFRNLLGEPGASEKPVTGQVTMPSYGVRVLLKA